MPILKDNKKYCFAMEMVVRDYEIDSQGIVNNAVYLHYMEHTRHTFCGEAGTSFGELQRRGIDPVVRKIEVEYLNSLRIMPQSRAQRGQVHIPARHNFPKRGICGAWGGDSGQCQKRTSQPWRRVSSAFR